MPRHTSNVPVNIYLIKTNKIKLLRYSWLSALNKKEHTIQSTFTEKKLTKIGKSGKSIISDWAPGINLVTYKMYYGAYPSKDCVKDLCKSLSTIQNNDWLPNNMILQGKKLLMIDINDPNFYCGKKTDFGYSQKRLNAMLKWLDLDNPADIQKFFTTILCKTNAKMPKKI